MYVVRVFVGRKVVDRRRFSFGDWMEIGLWLDNYGYNDPGYRVNIQFEERG